MALTPEVRAKIAAAAARLDGKEMTVDMAKRLINAEIERPCPHCRKKPSDA